MATLRLFDLNDQQRTAVTQIDGSILILAGAGTGKTRVITARIAYLISNGIDPENILAVTFTNKAANEMRERVASMLEKSVAKKITISTFHALCVRILRADIEKLGYKNNFSIIGMSDAIGIIKQSIKQKAARDEKLDPNAAIAAISKAKNNGWAAPDDDCTLVGAVYARYQKELKRLNSVDFDDLLLLSVRLLQEHPEIRQKWQQRFRYLMVDEFQDTNRLQLNLVSLIAKGSKTSSSNICVVGDDDQSIYGWRGAEVSNILEFENHFPNPTIIKLEQNYRSTNSILNTANSLIKNNPRRRSKNLWSAQNGGQKVRIIPTPHDSEEASYIANDIYQRFTSGEASGNNGKPSWTDFAILFRTNIQSRPLEEELRRTNIPYQLIGGKSFFDRREVKDFIAYLGCLLNTDDDNKLLRIINLPPRGIGANTIESAIQFSIQNKLSLFKTITNSSFLNPLRPQTRAALVAFAEMLDEYETKILSVGANYSEVANKWLDEIGYLPELKRTCASEDDYLNRERSIYDLLEDLKFYQQRRPSDGLRGFLDEVSLDVDRADRESEENKAELNKDAVTLITLHAAKGLEFPHVYLVGLEEGILPHNRSYAEGSLDEERRLFYVGITRAQETLTVTYCLTRTKYGTVESRTPSSFLKELDKTNIESLDWQKLMNKPATESRAKNYFSKMREMVGGI